MSIGLDLKSVLVVDDHDLIRLGICRMLTEVEGIAVTAQASSGEEAVDKVREMQPDIVFMDIRMPGIGGIEATHRILTHYPDTKVIVVSAFNDDVHPAALLKAGASAYITKNANSAEVKTALQKVLSGGVYISPELAQMMALNGVKPGADGSPLGNLSQRELQIAALITSGHRAKDVADTLNISPKTINTYKYRIYEKLGVSNDVELTLAAVKYGLVDPSEVI